MMKFYDQRPKGLGPSSQLKLFFSDKRLRFLVMPRFGVDLQSVIDNSGNVLSTATTANIAKQVVSGLVLNFRKLQCLGSWQHH